MHTLNLNLVDPCLSSAGCCIDDAGRLGSTVAEIVSRILKRLTQADLVCTRSSLAIDAMFF